MAWKVPAQVSPAVSAAARAPMTSPAIRSMRRVISAAARREKVMSRMRRGSAPSTTRCATRCASVPVLPDPAPAMTRRGCAAPCRTAVRCAGFSRSSQAGQGAEVLHGRIKPCFRSVRKADAVEGGAVAPTDDTGAQTSDVAGPHPASAREEGSGTPAGGRVSGRPGGGRPLPGVGRRAGHAQPAELFS